MNRFETAQKIQKILDKLYPAPPISLQHQDPYTLLIAVLLSAQSTDARVNKVTKILYSQAFTPHQMIQLSIEEIEAIICSCGLGFRKAQAIWNLSHLLIAKYQGLVPSTFEALESLPGVGHKTASVVLSQAFGQAAFAVDTHIHRCAKRWGLSTGKNVKQTEKDLKELFPEKDWSRLHLQIIYFARQHCKARAHFPSHCPICQWISN